MSQLLLLLHKVQQLLSYPLPLLPLIPLVQLILTLLLLLLLTFFTTSTTNTPAVATDNITVTTFIATTVTNAAITTTTSTPANITSFKITHLIRLESIMLQNLLIMLFGISPISAYQAHFYAF